MSTNTVFDLFKLYKTYFSNAPYFVPKEGQQPTQELEYAVAMENPRPKGSIAYKLGLLAAGNSDFVISMTPKSIWDIAGGTLLCQRSKIKFYSEGKEVLEVKQNYLPPLIWCHEEIFEELSSLL